MHKLTSRKFWVAIVALLVLVADALWKLDLPLELTAGLAATVVAWLAVEGYADGQWKVVGLNADNSLLRNQLAEMSGALKRAQEPKTGASDQSNAESEGESGK